MFVDKLVSKFRRQRVPLREGAAAHAPSHAHGEFIGDLDAYLSFKLGESVTLDTVLEMLYADEDFQALVEADPEPKVKITPVVRKILDKWKAQGKIGSDGGPPPKGRAGTPRNRKGRSSEKYHPKTAGKPYPTAAHAAAALAAWVGQRKNPGAFQKPMSASTEDPSEGRSSMVEAPYYGNAGDWPKPKGSPKKPSKSSKKLPPPPWKKPKPQKGKKPHQKFEGSSPSSQEGPRRGPVNEGPYFGYATNWDNPNPKLPNWSKSDVLGGGGKVAARKQKIAPAPWARKKQAQQALQKRKDLGRMSVGAQKAMAAKMARVKAAAKADAAKKAPTKKAPTKKKVTASKLKTPEALATRRPVKKRRAI